MGAPRVVVGGGTPQEPQVFRSYATLAHAHHLRVGRFTQVAQTTGGKHQERSQEHLVYH